MSTGRMWPSGSSLRTPGLESGLERSVGFFLLVSHLGGGRGGSQPCAGSGMDLLPTEWLFNGWISSYFCPVPSNTHHTEIRTLHNPAISHPDHMKFIVKALHHGPAHQPHLSSSYSQASHAEPRSKFLFSNTRPFFPPGICPCCSLWLACPSLPFAACPLRLLLFPAQEDKIGASSLRNL